MDPEQIGPYRVIGTLGEGAMGVVYRGIDPRSGDDVAIKTARAGEMTASNLRSELRALTRLRDPRIVPLLDYGQTSDGPWYAMEFVHGETWQAYNRRLWAGHQEQEVSSATLSLLTIDAPIEEVERPLPSSAPVGRPRAAAGRLGEVLALARKLCPPLALLHGNGLVHRDLKPANVVIRPDGTPVVMDLGVVSRYRGAVGRERVEVSGALVGTVAYMPPEQARGQRVDARADLYALGAMLYESVTGRLPLAANSLTAMVNRVLNDTPDPPSVWVDDVPPELEELILTLLAKDPRRRLGYAEDVAAVLEGLGARDDVPVVTRPYLYRPELVGREAEVAELERAVDGAVSSRGGIVLIGGESGVGKSFLASEAARFARVRRISVVVGEALPTLASDATFLEHTGAPFHPLRPFLVALSDRCRVAGLDGTAKLLADAGPLLAPYEPALRDAPGADRWVEPPALSAELSRPRLFRAFRGVLERWLADVGPLLLVLDDLQWADELTMGLLGFLDAEWFASHPLVVVGTWRTEELDDLLRELLRHPVVRRIDLARLDAPRVRSIIADMLAMTAPPVPLTRALTTWSEGNPFFVAEYLRLAAEEGYLDRREGRWQLAKGDLVGLPEPRSVQELVAQRLDGVPAAGRAVLEAAAVLGRQFDLALLAPLLGPGEVADGVVDSVRELERQQILEALADDEYRFVHDKLREIVHARIPRDRRVRLHGEAARVLESAPAGARAGYRELANHWRQAESWDRALDYLEKAGDEALRTFSNVEAIDCFEEATELAEEGRVQAGPHRVARWERALGEAWLDLGDQSRGQEFVERALLRLGHPALPRSTGAQAAALLGQVAVRVAMAWVPGPFREQRPDRQDVLADAAQLYNRLLEPLMLDNQPLLGLYCGLRNLNLAERTRPTPALARGYGMMAAILANTPMRGVAQRWADRAAAVAESIGSPGALAYALHRGAVAYFAPGQFDEAMSRFERSRELAERHGDRRRLDEARAGLAIGWAAQGRWQACVEMGRSAFDSAGERGDVQVAAWSRALLLEALSRLGREGDARELSALPEDAEELGDGERTWLHIAAGVARVAGGDYPGARRETDAALEIARRSAPVGYFLGAPLASLVEVRVRLWERSIRDGAASADDDGRSVEAALGLLRRFAPTCPFVAPFELCWTGTVDWNRGKQDRAVKRWTRAAAEAERLGMWQAQGAALAERGVALRDRATLEAALEVFTKNGAVRDRVRVIEALG